MKKEQQIQIQAFIEACHKVADYGLIRCSSGNMSYRLDEELAVLSATGAWLGEITEEEAAVCSVEDGKCVNGKTPTIENAFHLQILQERPEVNVVLHFQSPSATAIACGNPDEYNFNVILEIPCYIGQPAVVEYAPPGSAKLAKAVTGALNEHELVILRNHGLVTVGKDFQDAIQKASFFELACQILLMQKKPTFLSQKDIDNLRTA